MNKVIDFLCLVVGVIAVAAAIWQFFVFITFKDARGFSDIFAGTSHLMWSILALIIACACMVMYFVRHTKPTEEIHITK